MSATTAVPGTGVPGTGTDPAPRRRLHLRHRSRIVIGLGLVAATAVAVLGGGGPKFSGDLDPQNAGPNGARAVARVLEDQGVDVVVARDADELVRTGINARTTVLVTATDDLGRSTAQQVRDLAGGTELVVVDPHFSIAPLFGTDEGRGYARSREVGAGCEDGRFAGLELASRRGSVFPATPGSCFPVDQGALLTRPVPGVTVLGAADLLSNEQVRSAANAAVALRLLGQRDRLVWYVPDPADLTGSDAVSLRDLLPDWIAPGLVLLVVALLALMAWRGRRLGPLAVEPLPVTVTAIETTRARGRLYRKVNDRAHAATALRASARRDLVDQLALPRHAANDVALLVRLVAARVPAEPTRLHDLLDPTGPVPGSDHALITLANDLAALSREVRRP